MVLFLAACSGGGSSSESAEGGAASDPCASPAVQEARSSLLEAVKLPGRQPPPRSIQQGEPIQGEGFTMRFVRWEHGDVEDDRVHGLWLEPDPVPEGPLPLLVNVHGHWDAGMEADEVLFRSQLFAQQGWAVLSVAQRGAELGDAPVPSTRAVHFDGGLYGELRGRRTGRTPLGWYTVAAWGGLDAALSGRFSETPIEREHVALAGFSGGAEAAVVVGATDPRVGAVVIGAFEYGFGSHDGTSACSCGALRGGFDLRTRAGWLAQAACRPGSPPRARATLAWDGQPELGLGSELEALGAEVRSSGGLHGISRPMAAHSWAFIERNLRGRDIPPAAEDGARVRANAAWLPIDPAWRLPLLPALPVPGVQEQGAPPWKVGGAARPEVARRLLGLDGAGQEAGESVQDWIEAVDRFLELHEPVGVARGNGWVVVQAPSPALQGDDPDAWTPPRPGGMAPTAMRQLAPGASFAFVQPRIAGDPSLSHRASRRAIERGQPALGIAVADALDAARELGTRPDTVPERVGFVGVGAGGPAALWAAVLSGSELPVILVEAPASLWWDGPEPDSNVPVAPWPSWLLAPLPEGASLDPWLAASALDGQVRWVSPRSGGGGAWDGPRLPGRVEESLEAAFRD